MTQTKLIIGSVIAVVALFVGWLVYATVVDIQDQKAEQASASAHDQKLEDIRESARAKAEAEAKAEADREKAELDQDNADWEGRFSDEALLAKALDCTSTEDTGEANAELGKYGVTESLGCYATATGLIDILTFETAEQAMAAEGTLDIVLAGDQGLAIIGGDLSLMQAAVERIGGSV